MNLSRWDAARRKAGIKPRAEIESIAKRFERYRASIVAAIASKHETSFADDAYQGAFLTYCLASNDRSTDRRSIKGRALSWLGYLVGGDRKHNRPGLQQRRTGRTTAKTTELVVLARQCSEFLRGDERTVFAMLCSGASIDSIARELGMTKKAAWKIYRRARDIIAERTGGDVVIALPCDLSINRKSIDGPTIIRLRDRDGLSFRAIGERFGMTKENAHTAYKRAKKKARPKPGKPTSNVMQIHHGNATG
jgi:DNA-directed RNA polymerase specialized sigma24 family protein